MTLVIGREGNDPESRPVADLGTYRAVDGSEGPGLALDVDGPHAVLVVGKRGYGKSYTLGVLAEELARTRGLAPVVLDPMGSFATLESETREPALDEVPARTVENPSVPPSALDPRSWCALLGLSSESGAGALVWRAAAAADSLAGMADHLESVEAPTADTRAAANHLRLAASWGVFSSDSPAAAALATGDATVLDVSGLDAAPANAVARAVGEGLYRARVSGRLDQFPWLLVDESHTFFDGIAAGALRRILTRGRAPAVSLVAATQRPAAVPPVASSQSDVLIAHRLRSGDDIEALCELRPDLAGMEVSAPGTPGDAVVVDDATETVHGARIRRRHTPHGGGSPSLDAHFS